MTEQKTYRVHDWKKKEYLDGAMMRYLVTFGKPYPFGEEIAYFKHREDAIEFAQWKLGGVPVTEIEITTGR